MRAGGGWGSRRIGRATRAAAHRTGDHFTPAWVRRRPSPGVGMKVEVGVAAGAEVGAAAEGDGDAEAGAEGDGHGGRAGASRRGFSPP